MSFKPTETVICEKASYSDFVREMYNGKWVFADNQSPHVITHANNNIISTYPVNKGEIGTVMKITCPDNTNISICGRNHSDIRYPPYYFSLLCRDSSGRNLAPDTKFKITKYGTSGTMDLFCKNGNCSILYGVLSQTVGKRFKRKEERHNFPMGIILYPSETLVFRVYEPDINIAKTTLLMQADIWEKKEDKKI